MLCTVCSKETVIENENDSRCKQCFVNEELDDFLRNHTIYDISDNEVGLFDTLECLKPDCKHEECFECKLILEVPCYITMYCDALYLIISRWKYTQEKIREFSNKQTETFTKGQFIEMVLIYNGYKNRLDLDDLLNKICAVACCHIKMPSGELIKIFRSKHVVDLISDRILSHYVLR